MDHPTQALARTAQQLLDAFGGDTPEWIRGEAAALEEALKAFQAQEQADLPEWARERDVEGIAFPLRVESSEMFSAVVDRNGERVLYVDSGDAELDEMAAREVVAAANAFSILPVAALGPDRNPRATRAVDHHGLNYPFQMGAEDQFAWVLDRNGDCLLKVDCGDALADEQLARRVVASLNARAPDPAVTPARRLGP